MPITMDLHCHGWLPDGTCDAAACHQAVSPCVSAASSAVVCTTYWPQASRIKLINNHCDTTELLELHTLMNQTSFNVNVWKPRHHQDPKWYSHISLVYTKKSGHVRCLTQLVSKANSDSCLLISCIVHIWSCIFTFLIFALFKWVNVQSSTVKIWWLVVLHPRSNQWKPMPRIEGRS